MQKFRFKGDVLLFLGVVVLLATGVSNVQIPSAEASTQANALASMLLAKTGAPVAIVFRLCEKPKPKANTCSKLGNLSYVHNGKALAGGLIGHRGKGGRYDKWYICTQAEILKSKPGCHNTCPDGYEKALSPVCNNKTKAALVYWVWIATKVTYPSSVNIGTKAKPINVKVSMVAIGYGIGNTWHNGVFVCYTPKGSTNCSTKIPAAANFTGTYLCIVHYANQYTGGRQAQKPTDFSARLLCEKGKGSIQITKL